MFSHLFDHHQANCFYAEFGWMRSVSMRVAVDWLVVSMNFVDDAFDKSVDDKSNLMSCRLIHIRINRFSINRFSLMMMLFQKQKLKATPFTISIH